MKTIEQKASEAYKANKALAEKYQISDNFWMDWFRKGYNFAKKEDQWHTTEELRPTNGQVVLVKCNDDISGGYGIGTYHDFFNDGKGSFVLFDDAVRFITHWKSFND